MKGNKFFSIAEKKIVDDKVDVTSNLILEGEKETTFFTVAIPVYKRLGSLAESIKSIDNQLKFTDYAILLVDDNPERGDEIEEYLKALNHPKITYYKNEKNLGMSGNWNSLLTLAHSPYVIMLHDDDILYDDALLTFSQFIMQTQGLYSIYFSSYLFYDTKTMDNVPERISGSPKIMEIRLQDFLWGNVAGPPSGMCINREDALEMGGFSPEFGPSLDYDFYIKAARSNKLCKIIEYPLLAYRIEDNVSTKTETLLDFAGYDSAIKKSIINHRSIISKFFWNSFIKVQLYKILENMKQQFHNNTFNTQDEIKKLGLLYNKYDSLIYKIMVWIYFRNKSY